MFTDERGTVHNVELILEAGGFAADARWHTVPLLFETALMEDDVCFSPAAPEVLEGLCVVRSQHEPLSYIVRGANTAACCRVASGAELRF